MIIKSKNEAAEFDKFKKEINNIFDINYLEGTRPVIEVCNFYPKDLPKGVIVDNFLVKLNNSNTYCLGIINSNSLNEVLANIENWAKLNNINLKERYCFITLDQGVVLPGQTLRDTRRGRKPMWHLDGMQGDEVVIKKRPDIQFIWSDKLGTKFTSQTFNMRGFDPSKHHVSRWVEKQIDENKSFITKTNTVYAMNPYHAHRGVEALKKVYRTFLRISYTFTPITSVTSTLNKSIKYNYPVHSTSGQIPKHLV